MKYILSQQEYDDLLNINKNIIQMKTQDLQTLCTKISNEMPILFWNRKEAEPWGCTLSDGDSYCDECPVQTICPSPKKEYSK